MEAILAPHEIGQRLLAGAVAGMILGVNRDLKGKPTGLRTLALVSLGAARATVATVYFAGMQGGADALSRVVQGVLQGVLTGIAFLGAGAILRRGSETPGLTSAANVLVVASVGIACGLGQWRTALFWIRSAFIILPVLTPIEWRLEDLAKEKEGGKVGKSPGA